MFKFMVETWGGEKLIINLEYSLWITLTGLYGDIYVQQEWYENSDVLS